MLPQSVRLMNNKPKYCQFLIICMNLCHLPEHESCFLVLLVVISVEIIHGDQLNDFILLYEPVQYGKFSLVRNLYDGLQLPVITLRAFGRYFKLELVVGSQVLAANARIEVREWPKTQRVAAHKIRPFLVEGKVKDDELSYVHGCIYGDAFDGVIETVTEKYFVEPSKTYFKQSMPFKSVMYRWSDINFTAVACPSGSKCNQNHSDELKGLKLESANSEFAKLLPSIDHRRASIPHNCACTLKVMIDHTYYNYVGEKSVPKAISDIVFYVHGANKVFSNTDFDDDGVPDDIGFKQIMEIVVWRNKNDPGYHLANEGIHHRDLLLDYVSQFDFSSFCLGLVVVYRVFSDAVLGVALTASPQYNVIGGICQTQYFGHSYNTVLMTVLSVKGPVPRSVILNTITHEIGHSFGADHDPVTSECSPSQKEGGNYVMAFHSLPGVFPNNWRFSPCSKRDIRKVLSIKGRCLIPNDAIRHALCGNGIPEPGEECDCGAASQCSAVDKCCTPKGGALTDKECTIHRAKGFSCSPRMLPGECCRPNCTLVAKEEQKTCNDKSDCLLPSRCNGSTPRCPRIPLPNGSVCRTRSGNCSEGSCLSNICADLKLKRCECSAADQQCSVCCENGRGCIPASLFLTALLDFEDLVKPEGTPCAEGLGKCYSGVCTRTDHPGDSPGLWMYLLMAFIVASLVIIVVFLLIFRHKCLPCFFTPASMDI